MTAYQKIWGKLMRSSLIYIIDEKAPKWFKKLPIVREALSCMNLHGRIRAELPDIVQEWVALKYGMRHFRRNAALRKYHKEKLDRLLKFYREETPIGISKKELLMHSAEHDDTYEDAFSVEFLFNQIYPSLCSDAIFFEDNSIIYDDHKVAKMLIELKESHFERIFESI